MKKFGFGKKEKSGGDDPNRGALFGNRAKNDAASANPYAQSSLPADPYAQARSKAYGASSPQGPPTESSGRRAGAAERSGAGFGSEKYGAPSGYGANKFEQPASQSSNSRYGTGGYGGLGGSDAFAEEEANRSALFGGAEDRYASRAKPLSDQSGLPPSYSNEAQSDPYGAPAGPAYGDRQLTAEEEEEEDVNATKQNIRFMKREDVSSTRNALRIAQQAEESGRDTLARLGAQGEHIHNTEKNLDLAHNQNRIAEEKARELKTLNGSMFAIHVSNPFTAASRQRARDQSVIDKHVEQREAREAVRQLDYAANQRLGKTFKELQPGERGYGAPRGKNLAERAKFQFEADSEDEEMENEIDSNLDALGGVTGRLGQLALATRKEVDEQNRILERVSEKGDRVDVGIAANKAKLDRFH